MGPGSFNEQVAFLQYKVKEVGPLRSVCPRTRVTLPREGRVQWDLLCKT